MDDDVRRLRARTWKQVGRMDDPSSTNVSSSSSDKLFDFGGIPASTSSSVEVNREGEHGHSAHWNGMVDTNDDPVIEQSSAPRKSQPYSFIPPRASRDDSHDSIKTEDTLDPEVKFEALPGAYPAHFESKHVPEGSDDVKPPGPDTKPTPTANPKVESTDEDERTCRICFSPATPEEKLISPCKCRGTSKWIHISCLNQWRTHSQNSKSFYRCDQCHFKYSFRRTDVANLLLSKYTLFILTSLAFTFACFLGGFVIKFGLYMLPPEYLLGHSGWFSNFSFFYTPIDAGTDMLSAASALVPSTPHSLREIFRVDLWHFVQGLISLGIIGVVGFLGTGGLFSLRTFHPRRQRRQGDGIGLAEIAFIAVILLGCTKVAFSMWKRVQDMVNRRLVDLGEKIQEVDPDRD